MKIKKRQQPIDFRGLDEAVAADPAPAELAPVAAPAGGELTLEREAQPPAPETSSPPPAQLSRVTPVAAPSGWPIYLVALVVSVLWAAAPLAFALGYRRAVAPLDFEPFALLVFAALAIGPAVLVWVAAYVLRQGQKLAQEAQRAKALADEMISPAVTAGLQTMDVVNAVREEIARAGQAAEEARETMVVLRQALAADSEELAQAAANAARTAKGLSEALGRERSELGGLADKLDAQATAVADVIARQAKMVGEASDLAEAQLREAEASLASRAADLAAAAGETTDAARTAAEDLTRHIARLETAGAGVVEQIGAVEKGLSAQRASLVSATDALRSDQQALNTQLDEQTAKLADFISQARLSAVEMGDRAARGGEALRQLLADASAQFRELAETAKAERDEFGQTTLHSVEAVGQAAAAERVRLEEQTRLAIAAMGQAAEETRLAAARHAELARNQVDQLSEAAFTAGQQANKLFEDRLGEARALIEQSALMVEQAGAATLRKLDEGARAARSTLDELTAMLGDIEARATQLPAAAREKAEEVRLAVAESIDELMDHARRTADETQAIDDAFQNRVRRNYEMLSEAVRMMGSVATTGAAVSTPPAPRERPARTSLRESLKPAKAPPAPADDAAELELDQPIAPKPAPREEEPRARLRLTPTATDAEFRTVFGQATGRAEEPADEWTWKDLISSLEETEGAAAASAEQQQAPLEEILGAEIAGMGIDPAALLPRSRIAELASTLQARDGEGARGLVRKLAPAATRRLTRKLLTDETLKRHAVAYLGRYHELLDDAVTRDPAGFLVEALLNSEAGRTYLLFDAAAGDLI
ncbi:polar localization protein TipN [Phenylobacterium koreense]|uniref:ABC-type transporter Mla subunit MlaD n=2 Tax=Phenylobacterium TaxID=20 RepID=A0ABV2ENK7_9CAUL